MRGLTLPTNPMRFEIVTTSPPGIRDGVIFPEPDIDDEVGCWLLPFGNVCRCGTFNARPVAKVVFSEIVGYDAMFVDPKGNKLPRWDKLNDGFVEHEQLARLVLGKSGIDVAGGGWLRPTGTAETFQNHEESRVALESILEDPVLRGELLCRAEDALMKRDKECFDNLYDKLGRATWHFVASGWSYIDSIEALDEYGSDLESKIERLMDDMFWLGPVLMAAQHPFRRDGSDGETRLERAASQAYAYARQHGLPDAFALLSGVDFDRLEFRKERLEGPNLESYLERVQRWQRGRLEWKSIVNDPVQRTG